MRTETLPNGHRWLSICDADWDDPLDPSYAARRGGRWNPPDSWRVLYLNEDLVTARLNLQRHLDETPFGPEDLAPASAPQVAVATLPRAQEVADVHTPAGVASVGLPADYPTDADGELVAHETCQTIGLQVRRAGLRGVRCRSARAPLGAGREVAWFPATARSAAALVERLAFDDWFWG